MTAESRLKMSIARKEMYSKGLVPYWTGIKRPDISEGARKRMSGTKLGLATKNKLSISHSGPKHWNWQGGITPENRRYRNTAKWKEWRKKVFERDKYTCQECGVVGGFLEPHHIIPVRDDKESLFILINGITLCRQCHLKTFWKESSFAEKYFRITAAHV